MITEAEALAGWEEIVYDGHGWKYSLEHASDELLVRCFVYLDRIHYTGSGMKHIWGEIRKREHLAVAMKLQGFNIPPPA